MTTISQKSQSKVAIPTMVGKIALLFIIALTGFIPSLVNKIEQSIGSISSFTKVSKDVLTDFVKFLRTPEKFATMLSMPLPQTEFYSVSYQVMFYMVYNSFSVPVNSLFFSVPKIISSILSVTTTTMLEPLRYLNTIQWVMISKSSTKSSAVFNFQLIKSLKGKFPILNELNFASISYTDVNKFISMLRHDIATVNLSIGQIIVDEQTKISLMINCSPEHVSTYGKELIEKSRNPKHKFSQVAELVGNAMNLYELTPAMIKELKTEVVYTV